MTQKDIQQNHGIFFLCTTATSPSTLLQLVVTDGLTYHKTWDFSVSFANWLVSCGFPTFAQWRWLRLSDMKRTPGMHT